MYDDGTSYGGLSQLDHALQAAKKARDAGCDRATVVAALLHDIGWKLAGATPFVIDATAAASRAEKKRDVDCETADMCDLDRENSLAGKLGILAVCVEPGSETNAESQRAQHDVIGATYLRMRGFVEKVPHLVEGHVLAKRYLCWKEKDYYEKLSPGSKRTLKFQGGIMSEKEARIFESDPLFEDSLRMRRWDELAKEPYLKGVPDFDSYKDAVLACIVGPTDRSAASTQRTAAYLREYNTIVGCRQRSVADDADAASKEPVSTEAAAAASASSSSPPDKKRTKTCIPCSFAKRSLTLSEAQSLASAAGGLGVDWAIRDVDGTLRLERTLVAKNFQCALDFVNACGAIAERLGHHPDLHLESYRSVRVVVYTHKVSGLTEADFTLARAIDNETNPVCSPAWLRKRNQQ